MSDQDTTDYEALREERAAVLKRPSRRSGGLKPQQVAGIVMMVMIVAGGGYYFIANNRSSNLQGAEPATFQTPGGSNYGSINIAGPQDPEPIEQEVVAISEPPRTETIIQTRDSEETLRRLEELTDRESEARKLVERLQDDLKAANTALTDAANRITNLEDSLDQQKIHAEQKLAQQLSLLKTQMENRLALLEGELALARAAAQNQPIVSGDDDEQRRRLEALRKQRQLQNESDALIFDNSSEDSGRIRY